MSITKDNKVRLVADFGANENDSGNAKVQVAILTERINNLTEHMKTHKHDFGSRRGLLTMVGKRRHLLDYIKRKSQDSYKDLIAQLGLRR